MNPIERLSALHDEMRAGKGSVSDMLPIIQALKQREFDYEAAKVVCGNAMKELARLGKVVRDIEGNLIEMAILAEANMLPKINPVKLRAMAARLRAMLDGEGT